MLHGNLKQMEALTQFVLRNLYYPESVKDFSESGILFDSRITTLLRIIAIKLATASIIVIPSLLIGSADTPEILHRLLPPPGMKKPHRFFHPTHCYQAKSVVGTLFFCERTTPIHFPKGNDSSALSTIALPFAYKRILTGGYSQNETFWNIASQRNFLDLPTQLTLQDLGEALLLTLSDSHRIQLLELKQFTPMPLTSLLKYFHPRDQKIIKAAEQKATQFLQEQEAAFKAEQIQNFIQFQWMQQTLGGLLQMTLLHTSFGDYIAQCLQLNWSDQSHVHLAKSMAYGITYFVFPGDSYHTVAACSCALLEIMCLCRSVQQFSVKQWKLKKLSETLLGTLYLLGDYLQFGSIGAGIHFVLGLSLDQLPERFRYFILEWILSNLLLMCFIDSEHLYSMVILPTILSHLPHLLEHAGIPITTMVVSMLNQFTHKKAEERLYHKEMAHPGWLEHRYQQLNQRMIHIQKEQEDLRMIEQNIRNISAHLEALAAREAFLKSALLRTEYLIQVMELEHMSVQYNQLKTQYGQLQQEQASLRLYQTKYSEQSLSKRSDQLEAQLVRLQHKQAHLTQLIQQPKFMRLKESHQQLTMANARVKKGVERLGQIAQILKSGVSFIKQVIQENLALDYQYEGPLYGFRAVSS